MSADFEIKVQFAQPFDAETVPEPSVDDRARVNNYVLGMLANLEAGLPAEWRLEVVSNVETAAQRDFFGSASKPPKVTAIAPDRFAQIREGLCVNCGKRIVAQGDGQPYHVAECSTAEFPDDDT